MRIAFLVALVFFAVTCAAFRPNSASIKPAGRRNRAASLSMSSNDGVTVMINGMPGLMALETAKACVDRGFTLLPFGFTGPNTEMEYIDVVGKHTTVSTELIKGPGVLDNALDFLRIAKQKNPNLVVVDYTHPSAIMNNVQAYVDCGCDFVMGTTGGDPEAVQGIFDKGSNLAVIAPNMAKQIVAVQSTLLDMSERFPNAFDGYKLSVKESHQKTKADTSGTAKALVAYMSKLTGSDFSFEQIVKLRDRDSQLQFGVPEESLDGHAFHTYTVTSGDGTVQFELKHNVCGRRVYAEGTADAVEYLIAVREGKVGDSSRRLYNMIDVLQSGSMK